MGLINEGKYLMKVSHWSKISEGKSLKVTVLPQSEKIKINIPKTSYKDHERHQRKDGDDEVEEQDVGNEEVQGEQSFGEEVVDDRLSAVHDLFTRLARGQPAPLTFLALARRSVGSCRKGDWETLKWWLFHSVFEVSEMFSLSC